MPLFDAIETQLYGHSEQLNIYFQRMLENMNKRTSSRIIDKRNQVKQKTRNTEKKHFKPLSRV